MDGAARLERIIDLPRVIVWDALVDPILVEGWLHPTARLVDGVELRERRDPDRGDGVAILDSYGRELGGTRFELREVPGGTRGSVTDLTLIVRSQLDVEFRRGELVAWQRRLDQLESLLRGHPVDWGRS